MRDSAPKHRYDCAYFHTLVCNCGADGTQQAYRNGEVSGRQMGFESGVHHTLNLIVGALRGMAHAEHPVMCYESARTAPPPDRQRIVLAGMEYGRAGARLEEIARMSSLQDMMRALNHLAMDGKMPPKG